MECEVQSVDRIGVVSNSADAWPQVTVSSVVSGSGFAVPEQVIGNDYFAQYLETSDEWIQSRTGIKERRWAPPEMSASELAEPACRAALKDAGLTPDDIDGIVLATVTPDYTFPSTACFLQQRLGVTRGFAFDVNAVCSGFVYALSTADALIKAGLAKNILVVGVDIYSRILNKQDRATCVLFGDGAGAIVLSAAGSSSGAGVSGSSKDLRGIYACEIGADGRQTDILCVPNGTAAAPTPERIAAGEHFLRMEGKEVFKLAVRKLGEISEAALTRFGIRPGQVDYFVSHQANKRILMSMANQMGIPEEKVPMNLERYGNTSAASIPILLAESAQQGTIKKGDLLMLSAFGGGVTWGVVLLRW